MEKTKSTKPIKLKIKKTFPKLNEDNIEEVYNTNFKKIDILQDDSNFNNFLNEKQQVNRENIRKHENEFDNLYPSLDDENFNIKIAQKKEFNDNKYDGTLYDVEEQAEKLCNSDFELMPHQVFVRNFLSFQTPYNSLLLYHGLGTGKTCSAITVSEEMRMYLKQLDIKQRIIVVASPNVQENFKLQLFDDRKLKLIDGLWNLRACTGNKYLKEINPMNMKGLTKEKVIKQIKKIINNSYIFMGYTEFSNYIEKKSQVDEKDDKKKKDLVIKKIKKNFNNRLIIIDEIHNIRISDEKKDKRVANELFKLVKYADNLRLLFLSATPMYNSYKEIIWLLNIMNLNDRRSTLEIKDIFDKEGNLLISKDGENLGEDRLRKKATGYVSFVRGENPYTFPYRIFPTLFSIENTLKNNTYPRLQLNGKTIIQPIEHVDVFINKIGTYQSIGYNKIIQSIVEKNNLKNSNNFENLDSFGYNILQKPLQALNIIYPSENETLLLGSDGLKNIMSYTETVNPPSKKNFEYKANREKIFSKNEIEKYSSKMKSISNQIINSEGIVLIYSQFIDGGVLPMALVLEEMGFVRFGSKSSNLFKTPPTEAIDYKTFLPKNQMENPNEFKPATYTMITGEKALSIDKNYDLKNLTDEDNKNGEKIKVVLISKTGSEGIDFKNLRQVHILEPWYNLSLIEQIIGRAVRTCSHKQLPFRKRNVEIFLHSTTLEDEEVESADLYVYRLAEVKAVKIGQVSRVLKESSVDCILNAEQVNFSEENMNTIVKQELSNNKTIDFPIGDKPNTVSCDYMDTCNFKCKPFKSINKDEIKLDSFDKSFIMINTDKIIYRIKEIYKKKFFYKKDNLIREINLIKNYPLLQINAALNILIEDKNEYLIDMFGRIGHLINIDDYYLFQPIELKNENISLFDRQNPIDFKHEKINLEIENKIIVENKDKTKEDSKSTELLKKLHNDFQDSIKPVTEISRGQKDWLTIAAMLHHTKYLENMFNINREMYEKFIIAHLIEYLNFDEKLLLLNYLYFTDRLSNNEKMYKEYFDKQLMHDKNISGIILPQNGLQKLLIKNDQEWTFGKEEDYIDLANEIEKLIIRPVNEEKFNEYIGFVSSFRNEFNIFKIKNMRDSRNKGARCDQSSKVEAIKILNKIIGNETIDVNQSKNKNKILLEICVLQELVLRYYESNKKDAKKWFLTPTEFVINNVEKLSF